MTTLKQKYEIVKLHQNGMRQTEIAKLKQIPRSTIAGYIKNSEDIVSKFEEGGPSDAKRFKSHNFDLVDEPLIKFFKLAREQNIPISGEMLLEKAKKYAKELDYSEYSKLDINWINRWKKRNGIVAKKLHGEGQSADSEGAADWLNNRLPLLMEEYSPQDIINCDETGLFFRCLPDRTHVFKNDKCVGGRHSKERITVMVTASMAGERFPLLVIGKSANPRCFKGLPKRPLHYENNRKAWMTSEIFERYIRKLDQKMAKQNRKIALVLDNCTAHPEIPNLQFIKFVYLPPNTTSKTQPLDAGVIRCLKAYYRHDLAKRRLFAFENKLDFTIDIKSAMEILKLAWNKVTPTTILNCFKKVGFYPRNDMESEVAVSNTKDNQDRNIWERMIEEGIIPADMDFDDYVGMDEHVSCREIITEEEIEVSLNPISEPKEDSDDDEESANEQPPSIVEGILMIRRVHRLLEYSVSDSDSIFIDHAKQIENKLIDLSLRKTLSKQTKVTDYFQKSE